MTYLLRWIGMDISSMNTADIEQEKVHREQRIHELQSSWITWISDIVTDMWYNNPIYDTDADGDNDSTDMVDTILQDLEESGYISDE